VSIGEAHELHWTLGRLPIMEEEAEEVPVRLSLMARGWWWTAARRSDYPVTGKEEGDVNGVRYVLGQLFEEEGSKGLTGP
jgi:hypothetical protein